MTSGKKKALRFGDIIKCFCVVKNFPINFKTLFLVLFLAAGSAHSQFYNFPSEYSFGLLTERTLAEKDSSIHSSLKPYIPFFSDKYKFVADSHRIFKFIKNDPFLDKVFFEDLLL